ncbi:MAG: hypothetical protein HFH12_09990 [Dorea sp.]|nr:hypothetical protein [Dorea sp.]
MRFDTPVYFQKVVPGEYDVSTGNYGKASVTEEKMYADVTDAGTDMLNFVYGEVKQGARVIRLQRWYGGVFDRIRIGDRVYRVDFSRKFRVKQVFVVSEVQ